MAVRFAFLSIVPGLVQSSDIMMPWPEGVCSRIDISIIVRTVSFFEVMKADSVPPLADLPRFDFAL